MKATPKATQTAFRRHLFFHDASRCHAQNIVLEHQNPLETLLPFPAHRSFYVQSPIFKNGLTNIQTVQSQKQPFPKYSILSHRLRGKHASLQISKQRRLDDEAAAATAAAANQPFRRQPDAPASGMAAFQNIAVQYCSLVILIVCLSIFFLVTILETDLCEKRGVRTFLGVLFSISQSLLVVRYFGYRLLCREHHDIPDRWNANGYYIFCCVAGIAIAALVPTTLGVAVERACEYIPPQAMW